MADSLSTDAASGGSHPIEISILGDLEVRCSGALVELSIPRIRQLLVSLVLDLGRPVATETLMDRLWGESPPATAKKSVQKYVWELRRALGSEVDGFLSTGDRGYVLRLDAATVDAPRFESLVATALEVSADQALELLQEAESLWRGRALEGFSHLEEALPTAHRLEELRLVATERRLAFLLELGRHAEALPELEQLSIENPLREELWAQLMMARARSGRRNDALAAFQQVRHHLADELGIEPSSRLCDLERRILDDDLALVETRLYGAVAAASGGHQTPVALGASPPDDSPARGLPHSLSSFVGRGELLDQLEQQLTTARLITLTGVGGSGKTRLAVEVVQQLTHAPQGGAWFIDLSTIEVPELVVTTTAGALGVVDQPGTDLTLLFREMIGSRDALMIFDNCEHVLEVTAALVADLLGGCPNLTVLATSREPLGLAGEHSWPVPPLELPEGGASDRDVRAAEAVQLFVARAREVDPAFELDEQTSAAVVEICTRLDGVPLALELAAAQLRAMSATDMAARLDDRFRIMGTAVDRPPRQATLRATIDWSHGLLAPAEQLAFERISVFPASFDLSAAAAVAGDAESGEADVFQLLARLIQQSMVIRADESSGRTRYRLLDTLRTYGREILASRDEDHDSRLAHARHFARVAERATDPKPSDGDSWHVALDTDYPNLLAALELAVDRHPDLGARLVFALAGYWTRTPDRVLDGLRYVEPLLARIELEPPLLAMVRCCAAELRTESGEAVIAEKEARAALAMFESTGDIDGATRAQFALGRALANGGDLDKGAALVEQAQERFAASGSARWAASTTMLGFVRRAQGEYDRAERAFSQVLAWARRHDLAYTSAKSEWLLGSVAHHRGDLTDARGHFEHALAAFDELGDRAGVAHVRMALGDIARLAGDHDEARGLYDMAHEILSEICDLRCIASAVKNLGDLERHRDTRRAAELYLECLERRHALGDRSGVAEAFEGLAATFASTGRSAAAATLLGQAEALRIETGAVVLEAEMDDVADTRRRVTGSLSPGDFADARAAGAALPLDEAVATARAAVGATAPITH